MHPPEFSKLKIIRGNLEGHMFESGVVLFSVATDSSICSSGPTFEPLFIMMIHVIPFPLLFRIPIFD